MEAFESDRKNRLLGIDPGEKRIGIAISDTSGRLTKPYMVIQHQSRKKDVESIIQICRDKGISKVVVGYTQNEDGSLPFSGQNALRLAKALQISGEVKVDLWDEFNSTNDARTLLLKLNKPHKKRYGHHDDLAAAILLQSYIEDRTSKNK